MFQLRSTVFYLLQIWLFIYIIAGGLSVRAEDETDNMLTHPCRRTCKEYSPPMTCHYTFEVSQYSTMGEPCYDCPKNITDCFDPQCVPADGIEKSLVTVNRKLPGPLIEICKGDKVIVDVVNMLTSESTSVHWHGLHQKGTQYMDGVPYVTQCPILPGKTFRYNFTVNYSGTYFWHSHSFEQKADGMFGGFIVREPVVYSLYDVDEHVILLNEWTDLSAYDSYAREMYGRSFPEPYNILVNGLGRVLADANGPKMPLATFEVEKGKKYRFRIINGGAQDCPMLITIEKHNMLVISSDGKDINPVSAKSIRTLSGERFDIILDANQDIDNYWIKLKGVDAQSCENRKILQLAILRYKGAPETEPTTTAVFGHPSTEQDGQFNPLNKGSDSRLSISSQITYVADHSVNVAIPDHQFYISYDAVGNNMEKYNNNSIRTGKYRYLPGPNPKTSWQLNKINFKLPPIPLLTQPEMVNSSTFCDGSTVSNCFSKYCECTHLLKARLNSVVELVIVDEGDIQVNHPMHLHGYHFRVVAMERLNGTATVERIKQLDKEGKIKRNLKNAPLKDTVMVPSNGFTIVRFYADNPGYWLFHCHYERHAHIGMELLIKVGEEKDFPKVPQNFPRC